jgi:MerR family transcriptional regulator, light-induced transcriptional regulator
MSPRARPQEPSYAMRIAVQATGLTADTIRKWQQRHGAIAPGRTAGNSRRFTARDIRRLQLLKQLTERGHPIREVARLPEHELEHLLAPSAEAAAGTAAERADAFAEYRSDYLAALERYDLRAAGETLARAATLLQPTEFALRVTAPLLREVGMRWAHGRTTVAQEHAVSAQLRGLLSLALHLRTTQPGSRRVLVATPEGHRHEFGALIGAIQAAGHGLEPIYLGPDVPEAELVQAAEASRATVLLLSVVRDCPPAELEHLAGALSRLAARWPIWLGLPLGHPLVAAAPGIRALHAFEELDLALTQLAASARTAP